MNSPTQAGATRYSDCASQAKVSMNTVIMGLQWGDEGKGKVVDLLAPSFKYVVRFQGGNNAGHTLVVNGVLRTPS